LGLLGGPEDDHIKSKHVALTKYTLFVYKEDRSKSWVFWEGLRMTIKSRNMSPRQNKPFLYIKKTDPRVGCPGRA
jgi:hypothetical protein